MWVWQDPVAMSSGVTNGLPSHLPARHGNRHQELIHPAEERRPAEDPPGSQLAFNRLGQTLAAVGLQLVLLLFSRNWPGTLEETPAS